MPSALSQIGEKAEDRGRKSEDKRTEQAFGQFHRIRQRGLKTERQFDTDFHKWRSHAFGIITD